MDLNLTWFVLLGVLLMGYAILDGFDLGVGILHLFVRGDRDRRLVLNSIGPLWDGNEVWLVTFGGALFAAFPDAYATILSGFYFPVMLILLGLIGRAVSLEFRSKVKTKRWRSYWDVSFFLSSTTVTFVFGVALGNIVAGVPLTEQGEFAGSLATLLNPFALLVGALALAGAAMHVTQHVDPGGHDVVEPQPASRGHTGGGNRRCLRTMIHARHQRTFKKCRLFWRWHIAPHHKPDHLSKANRTYKVLDRVAAKGDPPWSHVNNCGAPPVANVIGLFAW